MGDRRVGVMKCRLRRAVKLAAVDAAENHAVPVSQPKVLHYIRPATGELRSEPKSLR